MCCPDSRLLALPLSFLNVSQVYKILGREVVVCLSGHYCFSVIDCYAPQAGSSVTFKIHKDNKISKNAKAAKVKLLDKLGTVDSGKQRMK